MTFLENESQFWKAKRRERQQDREYERTPELFSLKIPFELQSLFMRKIAEANIIFVGLNQFHIFNIEPNDKRVRAQP